MCVFTLVPCVNDTIWFICILSEQRDCEKQVHRDSMKSKETRSERHLWPVLGEHSYELVWVGLAALVQEA